MPFNGSGTFVPLSPPVYPAVPDTLVSASSFNSFTQDLMADGLSLVLVRDGQSAMTGDLNLGNNRAVNVATPTAGTDAVNKDYADGFIPRSGIFPMLADLNMGGFKVVNLAAPVAGTDAVNKTYADLKLALLGGTMGGAIAMGGFAITDLPAPSAANDAARKGYVDTFLPLAGGTLTGALVGTTFSDAKGNVRDLPFNTQTTGYTLVLADVGKTVEVTGSVTIPAGIFSAGQGITIYNNSGSSITLTQGGGLTLRLAGTTSTGSRTLSARGLAPILFRSSSEALVGGSVVT